MDSTGLKAELRTAQRMWRKTLGADEIHRRSERIFEKWRGRFSMKTTCYLHVYQTMDRLQEVDTAPILRYVDERHPHVRVVVPVVNSLKEELEHVEMTRDIELVKNRWGIPEPRMPFNRVFPMVLDMVIVPMLAFDMQGQRLGYGKGYYDRFLKLVRPNCLRVGLCYEEGRQEEPLPTYPTDIPMDFVVTEQRVYRFCDNSKAP